LIRRELSHGNPDGFNSEECEDEADWRKPCFPRFYLYDGLRGLRFILHWSERREIPLHRDSITSVVSEMHKQYPDGVVRIGRLAYEGIGTRQLDTDGKWFRSPTASHFPLLDQVSRIGDVSPTLSRHWADARAQLERMTVVGLIR